MLAQKFYHHWYEWAVTKVRRSERIFESVTHRQSRDIGETYALWNAARVVNLGCASITNDRTRKIMIRTRNVAADKSRRIVFSFYFAPHAPLSPRQTSFRERETKGRMKKAAIENEENSNHSQLYNSRNFTLGEGKEFISDLGHSTGSISMA